MRVPILELLASGDVLIADGATGTMLQAAGLPTGLPGEAWVLEQPEEIKKLHQAYVEAGSQLILTATFGGTRARLKASGLDSKVTEISRRAVELAREVAGDALYVGGDIGPTGEMMPPLGKLTYEMAVEMFAEQAEALADGGADCIYVETMSDLNEAKAAVEGAQQACDLPVFCTLSFDTRGRTGMGVSPVQSAEALDQQGVAALGANCGHAPEEVLDILPQMREAAPKAYLIAKPNAGIPHRVKRQFVYDAGPERMADLARQFFRHGAQIIGACCGSSPEHITAMARAVQQERGQGR
jgi:5-methyltetrahydrofolate--homocysteine methyltransferase